MINFSTWDQLLREYVNNEGQVNYQRWRLEAQAELTQWLNSISNFQLQQLSTNEALSLLINLYNALVIDQVLKQYPIASIRPTLLGIPNWISFLQFFTKQIYTLDNQRITLNDIEHKILRQHWEEPRIHFALVCAAKGCPLLRNEAYQPSQIYDQLEADATRFINNPNKVKYIPELNLLQCSKIFKWYKKDFLQVTPSLTAYISRYLSVTIPTSVRVKYLPYDWSLNQ